MTEITDKQIADLFAKYEKNDRVELWRLQDILLGLNINISEEETYNFITSLDIQKQFSLQQLQQIVQKVLNKTSSEIDDDVFESWQILGGKADKSGFVRLNELQQQTDQMGMNIKFENVVKAYYRTKNITQFNLHDLSYQVFKDIFTAFQDIID